MKNEKLIWETLEKLVDSHRSEGAEASVTDRFRRFVEEGYRDGVFGVSRHHHYLVLLEKLLRYYRVQDRPVPPVRAFDDGMLMDFRQFLQDECQYARARGLPADELSEKVRGGNTVVSDMKMLRTFFSDLEDRDEIHKSPFRRLGAERRRAVMRTQYDDPVFLRREEFRAVLETEVPETLRKTRDAFILQCTLGCRISDFQRLTMDNVAISAEGIPYIHYLPVKTSRSVSLRKEVETPLIHTARLIVDRYKFDFPILRYARGEDGYNRRIKQLLRLAGINRLVALFDPGTGTNRYLPLYEVGSSKLCRKTFVDMMSKVQVNLYASGLHKAGSEAVHRYTCLELADRYSLMCAAFEDRRR